MSYKSKHFIIQEYVPPAVYAARGDKAWQLIDDRLLRMDDICREHFGPIIINTWHSAHLIKKYTYRSQSGLRTTEFYNNQAEFDRSYSQHKYGRASDKLLVSGYGYDKARAFIIDNDHLFKDIKGMEEGVNWLHTDVRNSQSLMLFKG